MKACPNEKRILKNEIVKQVEKDILKKDQKLDDKRYVKKTDLKRK